MRKVVFEPTDFTLAIRRFHCPGARWDRLAKCWWMSDTEVDIFLRALDEECSCRMQIVVDGSVVLVAATSWMANYNRAQAAKPVREDAVDRSRRLRAQWRAEALQAAA